MPKIEIARNRSKVSAGTGAVNFGAIDTTTGAGEGLQQAGGAISAWAGDRQKEAQLAEDTTFVTNSSVQAQKTYLETQDRLQKEFAGNPKGYSQAFFDESQKINQGFIDAAPSDTARRSMQSQLAGMASNGLSGATKWERSAIVGKHLQDREDSILTLANMVESNPNGLGEALAARDAIAEADSTYLSNDPTKVRELEEADEKRLYEAAIIGSAGGISNGGSVEETVEALLDSRDDIFTPKEKASWMDYVKRKQVALVATTNKAVAQQQSANNTNVAVKMEEFKVQGTNAGELADTRVELDRLKESGGISPQQWISRSSDLRVLEEKTKVSAKHKEYIDGAIGTPQALSPTNKDHMDAADTAYREVYLPTFSKDPTERSAQEVELFADLGVIPKSRRESLEAELTMGTAKSKITAARTITDLVAKNPGFSGQVSGQSLDMALALDAAVKGGQVGEEAVKLATMEVLQKDDPQLKAKVDFFNATVKPKKLMNAIDPSLLGGKVNDETPPALLADVKRNALFHYKQYGNMDAALKAGAIKTGNVWSHEKILGKKEWVKYSPVSEYAQSYGGDTKAAASDLNIHLESLLGGMAPGDKERAEETMKVIPIMDTLGTDAPQYHVTYENENGVETPIIQMTEDGPTSFRLTLDYESGPTRRKQIAQQEFIEGALEAPVNVLKENARFIGGLANVVAEPLKQLNNGLYAVVGPSLADGASRFKDETVRFAADLQSEISDVESALGLETDTRDIPTAVGKGVVKAPSKRKETGPQAPIVSE